MSKYLFLFSISPVQGFISQARKVRDLKAGSMILSDLIGFAIKKAEELNSTIQVIFPAKKVISKPNRFLAELEFESEEQAQAFGNELAISVKDKFKMIALETFEGRLSNAIHPQLFNLQIENFLEVYWLINPLGENYAAGYAEIERDLAAVKNIKVFEQTPEQGRKCNLCGERNGLFFEYANKKAIEKGEKPFDIAKDAIRLSDLDNSETLCAVCFTKRYYPKTKISNQSTSDIALMSNYTQVLSHFSEHIPEYKELLEVIEKDDSTLFFKDKIEEENCEKLIANGATLADIKECLKKYKKAAKKLGKKVCPYYAILMFDGDQMGKWLSGIRLEDKDMLKSFHHDFSSRLGEFSVKASEYLNKDDRGLAIYAGGDDFLGFMNLSKFLDTAKELRGMFKVLVNEPLKDKYALKKEITFSAGISIAHYKTPLRIVLQKTREMENKAKEDGGRDALAICVIKHSGDILETHMKWETEEKSNIELLQTIISLIVEKKFSTSFITAIQTEFAMIAVHDTSIDKKFKAELKRLLGRSCNMKKEEKEKLVKDLNDYLETLIKIVKNNAPEFFNHLNMIIFLIRQISWEGENNEN
jgi:CRISPR-associated protein Cmr2